MREEGASAVEFAILAPLVFMLIFGMLTGALAWNSKQALTQAAREAARYAATYGTAPGTNAWLDAVANRAVDSGYGELDATQPGRMVCVAYVGTTTHSRTLTGTTVSYGSTPCFTDGRPASETRVQVRVERTTDFQAILFFKTITLRSDAVGRFEVAAS